MFSSSFLTSDATGEALAGVVGGVVSKLVDHPLDTIKARMQVATSSSSISAATNNNSASMFHQNCSSTSEQFQQHNLRHHEHNNPYRITQKFRYEPHHFSPSSSSSGNTAYRAATSSSVSSNKYNSSRNGGEKFLSTRETISLIYREEGLAGFYSGISSPLISNAVTKAMRFGIYGRAHNFVSNLYFDKTFSILKPASCSAVDSRNSTKEQKENNIKRKEDLPLVLVSLAGGFAGAACCSILNPLEVTKIRAQTDPKKYPGLISCFSQSFVIPPTSDHHQHSSSRGGFLARLRHGIRDLYSGFSATLIKEGCGYMWWFYVYEKSVRFFTKYHNNQINNSNNSDNGKKKYVSRDDLPYYYYLLSGCLCGFCFWAVFYPADTIKTVMQSPNPRNKISFDSATGQRVLTPMNFRETFADLLVSRGISGMYRGIGITLLRSLPGNGLVMLGYETTMKFWRGTVQKNIGGGHDAADGNNEQEHGDANHEYEESVAAFSFLTSSSKSQNNNNSGESLVENLSNGAKSPVIIPNNTFHTFEEDLVHQAGNVIAATTQAVHRLEQSFVTHEQRGNLLSK